MSRPHAEPNSDAWSQIVWQCVARFIAHRPRLVDWIIQRALRHPYLHIESLNGDRYMGRWWLLRGRPAQEDCPWWLRWCPVAIRIHHIAQPDADRHLHDHPIDFRTMVLRGWYCEEDIFGTYRMLAAGSTYASRAERFHRIDEVSTGGVWTLFILGPRRNLWGFLVDAHKVPWNDYLQSPGSAYRNPYERLAERLNASYSKAAPGLRLVSGTEPDRPALPTSVEYLPPEVADEWKRLFADTEPNP